MSDELTTAIFWVMVVVFFVCVIDKLTQPPTR